MKDNSKMLGYIGMGLGIASMITPLGPLAVGAFYLGTALAVATTAEACTRKDWNGCASGAMGVGLVGGGFAAAKAANTIRRDAVNYGRLKGGVTRGGALIVASSGKMADGASVVATWLGTNSPVMDPNRD